MKGKPTTFWAKLESDRDGAVVAWHPLVDHCADVAAVFEAMTELPTVQRRLARLAGREALDDVTRARLCVLVALHDLGKANIGFQAKGRADLGATAGHVAEAIALLQSLPDEIEQALDVEVLRTWGDAVGDLLGASICHHGRPMGYSASFQETWWRPRGGLDPVRALAELVSSARRWFPRAFTSGSPLPHATEFQHAFAGYVMLADWVGSDCRDTLFPFSEAPHSDRIEFARRRARRAIADIGIDVEPARVSVAGLDPFSAVAPNFSPRAAQRAILKSPLPDNGSITVLEAETGSGKTEAAVARFVQLFAENHVDGLLFALPTRTAATEIFERVVVAIQNAFSDDRTRPPVVLGVPGYLRFDEHSGQRILPGFEVHWPDARGARERHRGWAAEGPKRFLAAPVIVGTIDQVLLSGLMVSHSHLRAAALLRHLLVVDEVHASDYYMTRVLATVLNRHKAAGGHAILMSATLAGEARARLLGLPPPDLAAANATPYPLLSSRDGELSWVHPIAHDGRSRRVAVRAEALMEDEVAVAQLVCDAALRGGKVIVLRNTVTACIATQIRIERVVRSTLLFSVGDVAAPHHSRYSREDRRSLDLELEHQFGRNRRPGGRIVVATQTVQQSLDLDADLLVTDLCPVDVLLQRIGRLHRHERSRPRGFEEARAIVLVPSERDLGALIREDGTARWDFGIGTVYEDLRILEATWRAIENDRLWRIPDGCRSLVERCLHSGELQRVVDDGGDHWQAHANDVIGSGLGDRRQAELNVVDWSKPYVDQPFPDDRRIPSRLGEADRCVVFVDAPHGPFGHRVSELTIRASWAHGIPDEESEASRVSVVAGGFTFGYGPRSFLYDRFGLRPRIDGDESHGLSEEDDDQA